ncbi:MAG: carboxypeptidase-like regulatory domain-containing protein [Planctomycetota bacterium]
MNGFRFVKGAAVSLATLSMVFPQNGLLAEETKAPVSTSAKATKVATVPDIALTTGGTFSGRVVDHAGKVLEGAQVTVRQGKSEIGKTVTNKEGLYSFKNLKGGVYQVASGNTEGSFRVWAEKTAPPAAKEHALLVMGEKGARGQFGGADPTLVVLTGLVIADLIVDSITLNKVNDLPTSP